jgi:hypothetical protein
VTRLGLMVLAGLLWGAPASAAPVAVTQAELDAFVAAAANRDSQTLKTLFGDRILRSISGLEHKLASPRTFLETLRGCRRHRITRFPGDPDVFVEFVCPGERRQGPSKTLPGYVVRLWHSNKAGLSLAFSQDQVAVGPLSPPAASRN